MPEEPEDRVDRVVSRREFLKIAGLAGATVAAAGGLGGLLAACGGSSTTTTAAAATTTSAAGATTTTAAGTPTSGGATTTVAASAEKGDPVTVGALNSITGVNALTGAEQKWAQQKAADDQNANKGGVKLNDGKVHPVQLKFVDDQSSDTQAATATEQLIKSDNIKIILSSNTTPYNQAAATVCEQYQAYFHMNTSWIDDPGQVGGMHLKWSSDVFESAAKSGLAAVNANKNLTTGPVTSLAVMTENNPDGVGFGDGTVAGLKAEGWNVVSYEKFVEGQKDFSSIILKFKQSGVEGIVVLISPADGITFVRQLKQQGWAPKFLFGYKGFWPWDFMKSLGTDSNYIGHDGFWSADLPFPGCKALGDAFAKDFSGATSNSVGLPYAASQVLYQAIEAAGVFEPGPVRDQVFGHTFKGTTIGDIVYGGVYPNDPGIAYWALLGFQWINQQRVIVAPPKYATGKTQPMPAWNQR